MAALMLVPMRGQAQQAVIPFGPGVVLNYVMHNYGTNDWQFYSTIASVTPEETVYSEDRTIVDTAGKKQHQIYRRIVSRREAAGARGIDNGPGCNQSDSIDTAHRNSVLRMLSQRVFRQLKANGEVEITTFFQFGCSDILTETGTIRRVEPTTVPVSILLNGEKFDLATIHAQGTVGTFDDQQRVEFWFVDDSVRPWMVRESAGLGKQSYVQQLGTVLFPDPKAEQRMEQSLEKSCRAATYGIYFETASADLNAASRPTFQQIAAIMQRHPDWILTVEGHTDSIGGAAYNLDLSNRRSTAVKTELTTRYGIAANRLVPKGFGLGRPVQPNATIEGRARNRRVELVRACT
jgi:outer membrane protein OmpA-like peptidoglycan-associated protein